MSICSEEDATEPKKEKRMRKKRLLKNLQNQIEFYLGDANLRHDKFLNSKIAKETEGFVSIDLIASFKEVKKISENLKLIVKAIKNSPLLEMNEECTLVRRRTPLPKQEDAETRTVYVERLPHFVDRCWLRDVFSCCGHIEYISLPRYKNSKEIKGFAFIEYKTDTEAEKACQVFNTVYCMTNKPNGVEYDRHSKSNDTEKNSVCRSKRRRTSSSASSAGDWKDDAGKIQAPRKRHKLSDHNSEDKFLCSKDDSNENLEHCSVNRPLIEKNLVGANTEAETCNKSVPIKVEANCKKDGKRKRKRKKKVKEYNELEIPPLYVISKKEWIRLKDIYKSLQKSEASKLKKNDKGEKCSCKYGAVTNRSSSKRKVFDERSLPMLNGKVFEMGCLANDAIPKTDEIQIIKGEISTRESSLQMNSSGPLT
ncbi:la-related protein 7-like [Rhopilema esculentum]|uniref:la-related protein 7-like n=1 Tax=Rhopilema esculentum TaxID=499914 RepID=UPI0031D537C9